jgi:hypothetical protein
MLIAFGKHYWMEPRQDEIIAKCRGALETFWLLKNQELKLKVQEDFRG